MLNHHHLLSISLSRDWAPFPIVPFELTFSILSRNLTGEGEGGFHSSDSAAMRHGYLSLKTLKGGRFWGRPPLSARRGKIFLFSIFLHSLVLVFKRTGYILHRIFSLSITSSNLYKYIGNSPKSFSRNQKI